MKLRLSFITVFILLPACAWNHTTAEGQPCPPEWYRATVSQPQGKLVAHGSGTSLAQARSRAAADLGQQLSVRIKSRCEDIQNRDQTRSDSQPLCTIRSDSSARFSTLPMSRHRICGQQHYVELTWDNRALPERLGIDTPDKKIPYKRFFLSRQSNAIQIGFDPASRLWRLQHKAQHINVDTATLMKSIDWHGCEPDMNLQLMQYQRTARFASVGDHLELQWKAPPRLPWLTLVNVLPSGAVSILSQRSLPRQLLLEHQPTIIAGLAPGRWRSDEAYLLLASKHPLSGWIDPDPLDPALQLQNLFTQLASNPDIAHCATTLTIQIPTD